MATVVGTRDVNVTVEVTTEVVVTGGSCVVIVSVVPDAVIVLVTVEAGSVIVVMNVDMLVLILVDTKVSVTTSVTMEVGPSTVVSTV